jgi:predicted acetyltransferase
VPRHNQGMDIDVRPFSGDPDDFFAAGELAFSERAREEDRGRWAKAFEADRAIAAYDGERIVGTAGIFSFDLTVPGGLLPAAGITIVGVHPTHRRQGILRRMMRLQLDAIHERGEPLAILWASEGGIYQRFGYGLGSLRMGIDLARERGGFRQPHAPAGRIRFVELDEAKRLIPPIYDEVRPLRPGFYGRSQALWDSEFFADPEHWRRGASAAFHVVHEVGDTADGYARYRIRDEWDHAGPKSAVVLVELIATSPAAQLDLWRFLIDIDLMARIEAWNLAVDDPILLNVAEPRRLRASVGDALWTRIVDVAPALAGRRYGANGRIVFEVADEFCDWNDGTWELSVEDGVPIAQPASGTADLACDITDIGAVYLGAFGFRQLADAGRVRELQPGAVARADAIFRAERPPWCPMVF